MPRDFLIVAAPAANTFRELDPDASYRRDLTLRGDKPNVTLRLENLDRVSWRAVPAHLHDLAEVAAYIYCADLACSRGNSAERDFGSDWRRRFHFCLPVRQPERWRNPEVHRALLDLLSFLSEDEYRFDFQPLRSSERDDRDNWLEFGAEGSGPVDEVQLFSGGADSLAGAAEAVLGREEQVVLVFHQSNPKLVQATLDLARRLGDMSRLPMERRPRMVSLRCNRGHGGDHESTQRARSFLYAALGSVVAVQFGRQRLRFYENGITSINLPLAGQVVGTRASRTTHPRFLRNASRFLRLYLEQPFAVENPYWDRTKTQVLEILSRVGGSRLLAGSSSCACPRLGSNARPHCGVCSQCIDRRIAALAAGLEAHDPADRYEVDLLEGERVRGQDQATLAFYMAMVLRLLAVDEVSFLAEFGELCRVPEERGELAGSMLRAMYNLHRRHAQAVHKVLTQGVGSRLGNLVLGQLPARSLLGMLDQGPREPAEPPSAPIGLALAHAGRSNVFVQEGDSWRVRFRGGPDHTIAGGRGMSYLRDLLANPGQTIFAGVLLIRYAYPLEVSPVSGDSAVEIPGVQRTFANVAQPVIPDETAAAAYWEALARIDAELEQITRQTNETRYLELHRDRDCYEQQLRLVGRTRERSREQEKSDHKLLRDAVGNAIRAAVSRLREKIPTLGAHLKLPVLKCGLHLCYTPQDDTRWAT